MDSAAEQRLLQILRAAERDAAALALVPLDLTFADLPEAERARLRAALLAAAVPHWFDGPFLAALLATSADEGCSLMDNLQRLTNVEPFPARGESACNVHEASRLSLREHLRLKHPDLWKTYAQRAHAHLASGAEPHERIEALFHLFAADPEVAVAACETLDRDLQQNPSSESALCLALIELTTAGWLEGRSRAEALRVPLSHSNSLSLLGDSAIEKGDFAGAFHWFNESKTIREHLAESDPANPEWQRDLSVSLNKLGNLAEKQGDLAAASRYFTQSKATLERLASHRSGLSRAAAPPFQLPSAASKYFGRANLVADLAARLRKQKRTDVWGGPGTGKTALAAEAVARIVGDDPASISSSPFPHGVVFLDLYLHKGSLATAWHALANAFDNSLPTDMSAAERAAKACAHRQALIILDGAEELGATLTDFIAVLAPESTLLVLTREEAQTVAGRRIRLDDLLHADDALALLRHLAGADVPQTILTAVQARLGGHPLALTWAGSQLGDATQPPAHFLRDLESETFAKLTELGGKPEEAQKRMFDRGVRLMGDSTRTVLAAAARISEPFAGDFAEVAGGQEADLQYLVQLSFLRVGAEGWQFAHPIAARYARELPLPKGLLQRLGRWALEAIATADARCHIEGTARLGLALAHATALLAHDGVERVLSSVASALIYHDRDNNPVGIRRGRLDFARRAVEAVHQWQEQAPAEEKETPDWQRENSVSLNKLGDLAVAEGNLAEALRCFTESQTIRGRLAASDPVNAAWQRDVSVSLNNLGNLAVAQGDLVGALRRFTESQTIRERLTASDPANAAWQRDLSVSLSKLGDLALAQGDLAEALRRFTESKTICERLAASDPGNAAWQRDLSVSLEKLGDLAVAQGDLAGALRTFTEDMVIAERLAASDPGNAAWQRDLSVSLENLGDLALVQGDLAGALRYFTEDMAIAERLAASDPANAAWQRDLAVSHFKLYQCAQKSADEAMMQAELRACFTVLDSMKRRGLHLDAQAANLHSQLQRRFTQP